MQVCRLKKIVVIILSCVVITLNSNSVFAASYRIIHKSEGLFGTIFVYETMGKRCLAFGRINTNIRQSCSDLKDMNKPVLPYTSMIITSLLWKKEAPKNVLIVGLGGGSIQKAINILAPEPTTIETVEINPVIPKIAAEYFSYTENERNKIYIADAVEFFRKKSNKTYDLIVLDAFDSKYIPAELLSDTFMQNVKKFLSKDGILAVNTFISSKSYNQESALIQNNFASYYEMKSAKARIMFASNDNLPQKHEIQNNIAIWQEKFDALGIDTKQINSLTLQN